MTMPHLYKRIKSSRQFSTDANFGVTWISQIVNNLTHFSTLFAKIRSIFINYICRYDISESLFNVLPITSEIDTRKLLFFERLCRLDCNTLPKKCFLTRLMSFLLEISNKQKGFIPDIISILQLYNLMYYLQNWLDDGSFPNNSSWTKIVRRAVESSHETDRERPMSNDPDFSFFRKKFSKNSPASVWKLPTNPNDI